MPSLGGERIELSLGLRIWRSADKKSDSAAKKPGLMNFFVTLISVTHCPIATAIWRGLVGRLARGLRVSYLINFWVAVATHGLAGWLAGCNSSD